MHFFDSSNQFRPLRQTVSWDTPMCLTTIPQRTMSCDTSENNRCSNVSDESGQLAAPISSSSSEQENHETGAWSSDYSNSEDEFTNLEDGVVPVSLRLLNFYAKHLHKYSH